MDTQISSKIKIMSTDITKKMDCGTGWKLAQRTMEQDMEPRNKF